jgi:hypothetical protein
LEVPSALNTQSVSMETECRQKVAINMEPAEELEAKISVLW